MKNRKRRKNLRRPSAPPSNKCWVCGEECGNAETCSSCNKGPEAL